MKIAVFGLGYVGLSMTVLLSQKNNLWAVDVVKEKVDKVNSGELPISDSEMSYYFNLFKKNITATLDYKSACRDAEFIIIATPTNYNEETDCFDTSSVDFTIKNILEVNKNATIIIKSTVPVGFTKELMKKYGISNIMFSPEFLREGHALYDNLYPSRIVVGYNKEDPKMCERAQTFAELLKNGAEKEDIPVCFTGVEEAEAAKLFANTYLALRVAYFNELDTFAAVRQLDAEAIIKCVCLDPRIQDNYNNPSFGYGGYCLPKDSKQLLHHYADIPQRLISAVVESNFVRKNFIADEICKYNCKCIGVYRLSMKMGSDNYRSSSTVDLLKLLTQRNKKVVVYEPMLKEETFNNCEVIKDLEEFKDRCDFILTNRMDNQLKSVKNKVFTRDLFDRD